MFKIYEHRRIRLFIPQQHGINLNITHPQISSKLVKFTVSPFQLILKPTAVVLKGM